MKRAVFAIIFGVLGFAAKAQDTTMVRRETYSSEKAYGPKTFIWNIGIEPTLPVGHFHDLSGFGLGGSLQGEYKPSKLGITLNAGYISYFGKTVNGFAYSDFKYWPIMGGLKFYMSPNSFLHGQAGPGFGTNGLGTSFWYGGGIGVNMGKVIDAELKYTGWKQSLVTTSSTGGNGGTGGTGGTGGGGGYGGHYSTIGLRLGVNF